MGLQLCLRQTLRQGLNHSQKLELKQLIMLSQELKHPAIPETRRGMKGMIKAHALLQKRGACGVLIGGLVEKIWNRRRKKSHLEEHKDVDVLVLDGHFALKKKFEGGIDWWLPEMRRRILRSDAATGWGNEERIFVNGNGIMLNFSAEKFFDLAPGLYIPRPHWVIDMRVFETEAKIDHERVKVEFEGDVYEGFCRKIGERMGDCIPKFILDSFRGFILSERYEDDRRKIDSVELIKFSFMDIVELSRSQ